MQTSPTSVKAFAEGAQESVGTDYDLQWTYEDIFDGIRQIQHCHFVTENGEMISRQDQPIKQKSIQEGLIIFTLCNFTNFL